MNTPNTSTDFSPFQLCMGQLPHIIPPLLGTDLNNIPPEHVLSAKQIIQKLAMDINKAKDNLLQAKVSMAHYTNTHHGPKVKYEIGNWVVFVNSPMKVLGITETWGEKGVAKFFPQYDGPFEITGCHPEASTYTINMPQYPRTGCIPHPFHLVRAQTSHLLTDSVLSPLSGIVVSRTNPLTR